MQSGWYESLDLVDLPGTSGVSGLGSAGRKGPSSSAMFDPVFGPVGRSPLEKEAVLTVQVRWMLIDSFIFSSCYCLFIYYFFFACFWLVGWLVVVCVCSYVFVCPAFDTLYR